MIDKSLIRMYSLDTFLSEYKILNLNNQYRPVAVGRYGIRTRESIYSKELAKDYSKNKLIFKGTLTVGMGSNQMDIGILSDDEVYSVSPAYHTYRITNINYDYLRYCLQCRNKDMFIRFMKRGSRQGKSIDLKRWIKYKIPVYPSKIQLDIVKRLNLVQSIILERKKELDNLEMFVKARFVEMFGDPVYNPKGWPMSRLEDVCTSIVDCPHSTPHYTDVNTGYICIRTSVVKKNKILWDKVEYIPEEEYEYRIQRKRPSLNDVVYTREGAILGIAAVIDRGCNIALGQRMMLLTPNINKCNPIFLSTVMNIESFFYKAIQGVSGSASPHINVGDIKNFSIIIPPIQQQNQFVDFVNQIDKSKSAIQKSLDETQTLFNSLMQEYFG